MKIIYILRSGRLFLNGRLYSTTTLSPHVRESKTSWDSGFDAVDSGFQVMDSSLCQWNLDSGSQLLVGFQIPWAVFRIPKHRIQDFFSCIPDSKAQKSGFHKQKFRTFPYMGRTLTLLVFILFVIVCKTDTSPS